MPSLVEIGPVVLEEKIFIIFINYLPLEKGVVLHLYKLKSPFTQGCFVPSFVEIGTVVLEKKGSGELKILEKIFKNLTHEYLTI